jgi:hypothetical protein
MGNITRRVTGIKDRLNALITAAGYSGGNMVHHSDEAGRPLIREVDLEFIAFIPGQDQARFIQSHDDLKVFLAEVTQLGFQATFNPGWGKQLGFSATPQGSWEV